MAGSPGTAVERRTSESTKVVAGHTASWNAKDYTNLTERLTGLRPLVAQTEVVAGGELVGTAGDVKAVAAAAASSTMLVANTETMEGREAAGEVALAAMTEEAGLTCTMMMHVSSVHRRRPTEAHLSCFFDDPGAP